eukprot:GHVP01015665.1.p1 GENE.GHVP01015665.1~~GHVP01015665.1.p1  ORF type:complete len:362 (+),score=62.42 GHVP01015665.1:423-1508(+)
MNEFREESRRHISSVVLNEERLGEQHEKETVRYVEVPTIQEVVTRIPRKEVIEVERRVPKYEYEWVEKIVEVPVVQMVDKHVDVEQIQEVIRHVPKREVVEITKEFVRHVPRIENKVVERRVEVPGDIVEVPKPYTVENRVNVPQYIDKEVPFVVSQTIKPVIKEGGVEVDVDVYDYQPQIIPVDIPVPKIIDSQLIPLGTGEERHKVVQVPAAHYNSMLKHLNGHLLSSENFQIPYVTENGSIPMLSENEFIQLVSPIKGAEIDGYAPPSRDVYAVDAKSNRARYSPLEQPGIRSTLPADHGNVPRSASTRKKEHRRRTSKRDATPSGLSHRELSHKFEIEELRKSPSQQKKPKSKRIFC